MSPAIVPSTSHLPLASPSPSLSESSPTSSPVSKDRFRGSPRSRCRRRKGSTETSSRNLMQRFQRLRFFHFALQNFQAIAGPADEPCQTEKSCPVDEQHPAHGWI